MRSHIPGIAGAAAGGLYLKEKMEKMGHRMGHHMQRTRGDIAMAAPAMPKLAAAQVYMRHHRAGVGTLLAGLAVIGAAAWLLSRQSRRSHHGTHTIESSIELEVPVSTAYNQWTQFEEFPRFMGSVESVTQIDDTHLHWRARVGGKLKEWDAEITEQIPDKRIAWRSTSGVPNGGVVTFHKISENRTRVMLQMDYTPETMTEKIGDAIGTVKLTSMGNLKRFKKLVEEQGHETGAWRGQVGQGSAIQH